MRTIGAAMILVLACSVTSVPVATATEAEEQIVTIKPCPKGKCGNPFGIQKPYMVRDAR